MSKKLFLLDAMALIFRAYYALIRNPRLTSKGKNTNAQFGFTNTLLDLLNNQRPTHMAVCFDTHAPTERHIGFADYKANRQETPEDILSAIPDIKKIIEGFCIPVIESDGYEADDIIGGLSKQAARSGYTVYMVTPDKDYGQLVEENILIYKPGYQGGDAEILGAREVCEKWNIKNVDQVIDILGLMGDSVDNIPGIPGVGEKTAAKLLAEYETLENVLENADRIKGALGEKIRNGRELAIMSKKLATIITDVPVVFHEEDFRIKDCDKAALKEVFLDLEFRTLGKRVFGEDIGAPTIIAKGGLDKIIPEGVQTDLFGNIVEPQTPPAQETQEEITGVIQASKHIQNTPHQYLAIQGDDEIKKLVDELLKQPEICFDTETTGIDANDCELVGMSFSYKKGEAYYVPLPSDDQEETKRRLQLFAPLFDNTSIVWIGQNLKYDMLVLKWYGHELKGNIFDTMLAHYVIDPDGKRSMDLLSEQYLGYQPIPIEDLIGKKGKNQGNMRDVELEKIRDYAAEDADITLQLKHAFIPLLKTKEVETVFAEVENPLVKVLADMEFEGIRVDTDFLKEYS
ncbi:MAG TPA: 5'-3' exonuclease H3TH domain-containing protein, partial [Flavitalea sp.]|nr:5'-3' exonuclease H3TH domain-containing protein [Flavitalea sp.]